MDTIFENYFAYAVIDGQLENIGVSENPINTIIRLRISVLICYHIEYLTEPVGKNKNKIFDKTKINLKKKHFVLIMNGIGYFLTYISIS